MISVIVCTYNQEKYITQAIDSILNQKSSIEFEILIGDDCSTDGTSKIVDQYQILYPSIVRVIRSSKNCGASYNIVRLIENARGEYVSICDGDDYWLSDEVLQLQYDYFKKNPEVGMLCAKAKCYIQKDRKFLGVLGSNIAEDFLQMCIRNQDVAAPTIAFRRHLLLKCISDSKWYIENNYFYDTIMTYWFSCNSKVKFIDKEIAVYRVLENSACHSTEYDIQRQYLKRYFNVKWHFLLDNPLKTEDMNLILMKDYEDTINNTEWLVKSDVYKSKSYRIGRVIISPLKFFQKLFNKWR